MDGVKLPAGAPHLREEAASLRKLAAEHEAAGNTLIAEKLRQVAAELDAKADQTARGAARP